MTKYRLGLLPVCLGIALGACFSSTANPKRDAGRGGSGGGSGSGGGGSGGGGSGGGGMGGSDGAAGADAAPADRTPGDVVLPDAGPAPLSAAFTMIYDNIIKVRCSPCHVTQMPRAGMLDMGDARTAFNSLTGEMTACATANPKDRVVAGKPDDSYLMKKLLGRPEICGLRMPRGCVEQGDAGAPADATPPTPDAAEPDAATADAAATDGAIADAAADAAVDAAGVDARDASPDGAVDRGADASPPLACLTGEQIMTIRNWISGLSKIRLLVVNDVLNAARWFEQSNFQIGPMGAHPWADYPNSYVATLDPAAMTILLGKPWISVVAASKNYVGGPQATITLSAPADVYLVVDDRFVPGGVAPWLTGWTDTGLNAAVFENTARPALAFSLYKKSVPAGAVTVPAIGDNRAFDYFIIID